MKRKSYNFLLFLSIFLLISLVGLAIGAKLAVDFSGCGRLGGKLSEQISRFVSLGQERPSENGPPGRSTNQTSAERDYVDITIASVGDVLIHNTLYYAAYDPAARSYDFNDQFKYVKPYLTSADVAIANLETTLAGPEKGYSSYPKFNTPDSIVDALKNAGVDVLTAANNHRMDTGIPGFYRTIRVVRNAGLDIIGVKAEEKEKTYVLKDIKGVKTAFLNFGYGFPLGDGSLSINGLILPVDMSGLVDIFDPQDLNKSIAALSHKIQAARDDGAELIVVCMHWGDEYQRQPNDFQQKLAANMVALGADVIFGGHPHVLQPAVYLPSSEESRVPVFYSLGNFISDQRKETVDDIYTEQGMIAKVTFRVQKKRKPLPIEVEAIPTWVNKKTVNGRYRYEVIPAQEALQSKEKFPLLNAADLERIRFCSDHVSRLTLGIK